MSNYNSTHTGAQLDEAIGRVLDGGSIKVQTDTNTADITDLKGRMTTAEGAISSASSQLEAVEATVANLEGLEVAGVLKPVTFDSATGNAFPATTIRFHCDNNFSNAAYRGRTILGVRVKAYNSGTLKIVKGVNVKDGSTTATATEKQSFSVTAGINTLMLDDVNKFTCEGEEDFVGIVGTGTTQLCYVSAGGGGSKFLYLSSGTVDKSSGTLSVEILVDADVVGRISALEQSDFATRAELDEFEDDVEEMLSDLQGKTVIASSYINVNSGTGISSQPANLYRFPVPRDNTNKAYRGKKIKSFRFRGVGGGTLSVVKGTLPVNDDGKISTATAIDPTTDIEVVGEPFSVTSGRIMDYTIPTDLTISDANVFFGFITTTSKPYQKSNSGDDAHYFYVNNSTHKCVDSSATVHFSMTIEDPINGRVTELENDMEEVTAVIETLDPEAVASIQEEIAELNLKSELIDLPILSKPYFYHWKPDGFIMFGSSKGIPSQSVEDNFFASRLGFGMVEANVQATADGEYIITHGQTVNNVAGCFGNEFSDTYKGVQVSTMTLDEILANVSYNSDFSCYNHHPSTAREFFKNCAQLGLGVCLRSTVSEIMALARTYIPDNRLCISLLTLVSGNTVRSRGFRGMIGWYIGSGSSATICDAAYLRNIAETYGGAPFHIALHGTHVQYMIDNGTIDDIVAELRADGIYVGAAYASQAQADRLIAAGGWGIASQVWQCNPFSDANIGAWNLTDTSLSGWTIPSGVTVSGGRIVNSGSSAVTITTPTTGVVSLGKGNIQARATGSVTFGIGGNTDSAFTACTSDVPIAFARAAVNSDMQLSVTIGAGSSLDWLNYQATRC